jgi:hypothetical protein
VKDSTEENVMNTVQVAIKDDDVDSGVSKLASQASSDASAAKICPICGEGVFADMPVCFGCMHVFDVDEDVSHGGIKKEPVKAGSDNASTSSSELFNEFLVEFHRFLGDFLVNRVVNL